MLVLLYLLMFLTSAKLGISQHVFDRNNESFGKAAHCFKSVKCITIENSTCMGTPLSYNSISLDLIPDVILDHKWLMVQDRLHILQSLQYIPKCWLVVQPLLCSLYMPKCNNNTVQLPTFETCNKISTFCREVLNKMDFWPDFINCTNEKLFPKNCKKDLYYRETKFINPGKCLNPLIPTDNSLSMFKGIEGCGMPCSDPMYSQEEKDQIHSMIFWAAIVCFLCNSFTVITFLIDWQSANRYPAVALFYINCCFLVASLGWLAQFFISGNRKIIVCRKDGTLRKNEPSGENLSCVIIFIMIYYSMIAAMVWFTVLTYTCYVQFSKCFGNILHKVDKNNANFHIIAWCLALIMTVSVLAIGEVDGNHTTGICFVGYNNYFVRVCFVLIPVAFTVIIGGYFTFKALKELLQIRNNALKILSDYHKAKIEAVIRRIGVFSFLILFPVVITGYCHWYEYQNSWKWQKSFKDYIFCAILYKYVDTIECKMHHRPNAAILQLHVLAPFLIGILMSYWICTVSTAEIWIRFYDRYIKHQEGTTITKSQAIAQAYAQREKIVDNAGRCSIVVNSTHEDPVGLNFGQNNDGAGDYVSSSWAAHLPQLMTRRGALCDQVDFDSEMSNRRSSQVSLNISRCLVAVESRRNSCESQFSQLEILKTDFIAKSNRVMDNKGKRRKKIPKQTRPKVNRRNVGKFRSNRRASTTSQESQMNVQVMSAIAIQQALTSNGPSSPNMGKHSGFDQGIFNSVQTHQIIENIIKRSGPAIENYDDVSSEKSLSSDRENRLVQENSDDSISDSEEYLKMIKYPAITDGKNNDIDKDIDSEDEVVLQQLLKEKLAYKSYQSNR